MIDAGTAGGFLGAVARSRAVLIASGMLIWVSGMWHPLLWPALISTVPLFVLASATHTTDGAGTPQPDRA